MEATSRWLRRLIEHGRRGREGDMPAGRSRWARPSGSAFRLDPTRTAPPAGIATSLVPSQSDARIGKKPSWMRVTATHELARRSRDSPCAAPVARGAAGAARGRWVGPQANRRRRRSCCRRSTWRSPDRDGHRVAAADGRRARHCAPRVAPRCRAHPAQAIIAVRCRALRQRAPTTFDRWVLICVLSACASVIRRALWVKSGPGPDVKVGGPLSSGVSLARLRRCLDCRFGGFAGKWASLGCVRRRQPL